MISLCLQTIEFNYQEGRLRAGVIILQNILDHFIRFIL